MNLASYKPEGKGTLLLTNFKVHNVPVSYRMSFIPLIYGPSANKWGKKQGSVSYILRKQA